MMKYPKLSAALACSAIAVAFTLSIGVASAETPRARLSFINTRGTVFVDEADKPVSLHGCNLGNWLLIEIWMFGGCFHAPDQAHLFATLDQRFGAERSRHLMDTYRASYITPRDFHLIKSFGFNTVRLPIDHRLLQSDEAPYAIKPDAFKWIDRAVDMADASGVYIILDLHSAPGGQSNDQCTGEIGTNNLWNNAVNQRRLVEVWRAIATRYRNRPAVAGYDLMNEPYADHKMDVREQLRTIMGNLYAAIREAGDHHVVFFPGALGSSPAFYDDPHKSGWTNVAFTEHFYPGLFGDKTAFESHLRTLTRTFPARQKWLDHVQSPFYIGEFNPVLDSIGGARITRAYYDAFAEHGWAGTLWSYKLIKPAGGATSNVWYCVSNAEPLTELNLQSSSYEEFESFFKSMATIPLAANPPLLKALTDPSPTPLPGLTAAPPQPTLISAEPNDTRPPAGWSTVDIGGAPPGGVSVAPDGTITASGGGMDIFGRRDSFRFISKPADGEIAARVLSLAESDPYAKAGVMARWGDAPAAPFAMVNTFPDGTVAFLTRAQPGEEAKETKTGSGAFPVDLRLALNKAAVAAYYRRPGGEWISAGSADLPAGTPCRTGLALSSHSEDGLTRAVFRLIDAGTPAAALATNQVSLLKDQHWSQAGDGFDAATMVYHGRPGELWRQVPVTPGARYRFTLQCRRDDPANFASVELRLQNDFDGNTVTLNSVTIKPDEISAGDKWTQLSISGTALGEILRIRIVVTPAASAGNGTVTFGHECLQAE